MKSVCVRIAIYCACALCLLNGCSPERQPTATTVLENSNETRTVAIRVDTMNCVNGCFNGIQSVLEKREEIASVKLAPQKEEGVIDNSVIYVDYRGKLDRQEIERLVVGAGFDGIEFLEDGSE